MCWGILPRRYHDNAEATNAGAAILHGTWYRADVSVKEENDVGLYEGWEQLALQQALEALAQGLDAGGEGALEDARSADVLGEVAQRMRDNYPYHDTFYIGQMLKPPHPVARLAYHLAMTVNPNNHAYEGGRASSDMERECIAHLASMIGWDDHIGHLTGGGTVANLEALWVASKERPGAVVLVSEQAHYTHARMCDLIGVTCEKVASDQSGRMDMRALSARLESGDIGCVVATLGTTALGAVDPLDEILELREQFGFRVHVDAAYGGYFAIAGALDAPARRAFDSIREADSCVIDPHKHGLQPYGCGCVLLRDPEVARHYHHDSPYTYFTAAELHLGEISLECSRPGAAAVALWATQRRFPCTHGAEFAGMLDANLRAARALVSAIEADGRARVIVAPQLDIVVWAPHAVRASDVSAHAQAIFDVSQQRGLHLAMTTVSQELARVALGDIEFDEPEIKCLRACLMKPEHEAAMPEIAALLIACMDEALG